MRNILTAIVIALALNGCAKVDKDICWEKETKVAVDALVSAQSDDTSLRVKNFFEFKNIEIYFGSINAKTTLSDFSIEKIDKETETVDCSATLSLTATFNSSAELKNSGRVRFSSKVGEHGRYIELTKTDIPPIVIGLN